jgi:hypothetical protein
MGSFMNMLNSFGKKAELSIKKNGPTIMVVTGVLLMASGTVYVAAKSNKSTELVEQAKKDLEVIRGYKNCPEKRPTNYTEKDVNKEIAKVYLATTGKVLLTNAPAIAAEVGGAALILGGTKIINDRLAVTSAALSTALGEFENYRKKIIEKFGDEGKKLDSEIRYGLREGEITEEEETEDGKKKKKKKKVMFADEEFGTDGYRRMFDFRNPYWEHHPDYCLMFLTAKQNYFNDKLRADGFVFLNDVLKELGFEPSKAGQLVGWMYDPDNERGDNYIDFRVTPARLIRMEGTGVDDVDNIELLKFPERNCGFMLDFNVDGNILSSIDWNSRKR